MGTIQGGPSRFIPSGKNLVTCWVWMERRALVYMRNHIQPMLAATWKVFRGHNKGQLKMGFRHFVLQIWSHGILTCCSEGGVGKGWVLPNAIVDS